MRLDFKIAQLQDVDDFAKVRSIKGGDLDAIRKSCADELQLPNYEKDRIIFLGFSEDQIAGYGRVMKFERDRDGNLYSTKNPLPEGWYLRGVVVLPKFRSKGVAKLLTGLRLKWLENRSKDIYCFLDSEEKSTLPMYISFGFRIHSSNWEFNLPEMKDETGILLLSHTP